MTSPMRGQGAMRPGELVALGLTATIYLGELASVFLF